MLTKMRRIWKKYSLIDLIRKSFVYAYSLPLNLEKNEMEQIWRRKYKKNLKRYIDTSAEIKSGDNKKLTNRYIFICWLQGYNNAPRIVRRCIESIKKYSGNFEVVIISEKNLKEYIDLPEFILRKRNLGYISDAHFSDIIRVFLLCKYGGIWLDSTVMLFDEIPSDFLKGDLFFFQASFLDTKYPEISNWFICAKYSNNPFLNDLKKSLLNFWLKNNKSPDYFVFHDLVSLLAMTDKYRDYWKKMPYFNNVAPHTLQNELLRKYSEERLKEIVSMSVIQKLTYKINVKDCQESNYDHLLREGG